MKREILFRGKSIKRREWAYGSLIDSGNHSQVAIFPYNDSASTMTVRELVYLGMVSVDPNTVGQFTGMIDKNGLKIFDGDILRTKYGRLCIVEWFESNLTLCFDLKPICIAENLNKYAPDKWDLWYKENLEVIGNRFDNQELLEVKR